MYKVIIHVTHEFATVEQANEFYDEIQGELRKHPNVHVNGQVVKKFTGYSPQSPNGHEVPA